MIPIGISMRVKVTSKVATGIAVANLLLRIPITDINKHMNIIGNKVRPKTLQRAYEDSKSSWRLKVR